MFFFLQGPDSLTQKPGSPWDVVSQSAWLFGRDMAGSICPSAEVTWAISSAWKWGKWKFHLQTMLKWLHPGRLTWNMSSWRPRRSFSFLNGWFVGSMLSFQGVFIHKINIYTPPWERKKNIFPIATFDKFEGDMLVSLEGKSSRSWNQGSDGFFVVSVYNLVCSGARCSNTTVFSRCFQTFFSGQGWRKRFTRIMVDCIVMSSPKISMVL